MGSTQGPHLRGSQNPLSLHCCTPVPIGSQYTISWSPYIMRRPEWRKETILGLFFRWENRVSGISRKGLIKNLSVGDIGVPIFWLQFQDSSQEITASFWNMVSEAWLETHSETFHNGHPASCLPDRKIKRKKTQTFRNYTTGASLMRTVVIQSTWR